MGGDKPPFVVHPSDEHNIDGIAVTAYRTLHSGNREEPENLMYLIEMEGRTVFHEGDSDAQVSGNYPDMFLLQYPGESRTFHR